LLHQTALEQNDEFVLPIKGLLAKMDVCLGACAMEELEYGEDGGNTGQCCDFCSLFALFLCFLVLSRAFLQHQQASTIIYYMSSFNSCG